MDSSIEAALAVYEARWAEELALQSRIPLEEARSRVDEFLLPIGPDTGAVLNELAKANKAKTILEVGASYGYSTVWLADAARHTGGKVISLEMHPGKVEYAKGVLADIGLSAYVEHVVGDAVAAIEALPGPFDFVLIDLWKDLYVPCFERIYPKLSRGALVAADNIVFPPFERENALAYRRLVRSKPELESVLLPVGAGVELTRFGVDL
jgi:predicted O-methyltransferase YrrM